MKMKDVIIHKPKRKGQFPTILFVQGLGMTMHEWNNSFDEIAERLVSAGFQTVQFELPIFDKNGRCRELPLKVRAKLVDDAANKYKAAGLIAQSYGASTSMIAKLPTIVTRLFISPALSPMKSIARVYEEKGVTINYSGDTSLPRSSGENTTVGKEFWDDIKKFDDISLARTIDTPICILHGDQDTKIAIETVKSFFDAISVKNKQLKIYKKGDHGIVDVPRSLREECLINIVNWFNETLK